MTILNNERAMADVNNVNNIMGVDDVSGYIENIRVIDGKLVVIQQAYNPTTSGYEAVENAWSVDDVTNLLNSINGAYYEDVKIEYDGSNNPVYIGKNVALGASISGTDWIVTKCTYSGIYMTEKEVAVGAWSNRGGLF